MACSVEAEHLTILPLEVLPYLRFDFSQVSVLRKSRYLSVFRGYTPVTTVRNGENRMGIWDRTLPFPLRLFFALDALGFELDIFPSVFNPQFGLTQASDR
jgi:hypothetical protein